MKLYKALFAALALAAMPLAGCSGLQVLQAPATAAQATTIDEKALYAAEALYNVPAQAYVTADANGQLSPKLKSALKPKLKLAYGALLAIRAAYKAGNATDFATQFARLQELNTAVLSLIPK